MAADFSLCQSHPLLQEIPKPALEALLGHCQLRPVASGEILLRPGTENHTLYFLLQGRLRVQLHAGDPNQGFVIQPGEIIGEMSIIEQRQVFATVVVEEAGTVLAMPAAVFWDEYCSRPRLIPPLLQSLVMRMRRTNSVLQAELEQRVRYEMLQRELESAARIQSNILPTHTPLFENPAVEILPLFRPARTVGGDFYDVIALSRDQLAVAIGDVSGKGMPASLFMVRAVTVLRMVLLRESDPARILPEVNRLLCSANDEFMFVTLAVLLIDLERGRVTYLNGGHNPVLCASAGASFQPWDPPPGTLLGVNANSTFGLKEQALRPGDRYILYTDGITEAENGRQEMFGLARTIAALSAQGTAASGASLISGLEQAVTGFAGEADQSDDITAVALTYQGGLIAGVRF